MTKKSLSHFFSEQEAWQHTLDYILLQNIDLKNSLSRIDEQVIDTGVLEQLEKFQNRFLEKDVLISLLRHDIISLEELLRNEFSNEVQYLQIIHKHEGLKKDIQRLEVEFILLKSKFNLFLASLKQ
ncbi:MAG TPA: hypothetical protein PLQ78_07145 [Flavipsychrobacter sp.]|nr:hypothetical protein [Flavipsychrobacter sp.]